MDTYGSLEAGMAPEILDLRGTTLRPGRDVGFLGGLHLLLMMLLAEFGWLKMKNCINLISPGKSYMV